MGREYLKILCDHPFLRLEEVTGDSNVGRRVGEVVAEKHGDNLPDEVADLVVKPTNPKEVKCDLVFSPLPTEVAKDVESNFASFGHRVITDASPNRMNPTVPLIVPEINPDDLEMVKEQSFGDTKGWIAATPNCSAVGVAMVLAPLRDLGIRRVFVTTMQSVSGAGYPGVPSIDIIDNVIPYIRGEEEKIASECNKILGFTRSPVPFAVTATRVPVTYGHTAVIHAEFRDKVSVGEAVERLEEFRGLPQKLRLPSAPEKPIELCVEEQEPQPRHGRDAGKVPGMAVQVGRVRRGVDERSIQMVCVSNNLIRGGAGVAVLTAELAVFKGLV